MLRLSADFLLPHTYFLVCIYVYMCVPLVHVSTHKKYRFYQSLTQIKKRSNCFGNPKQKKSETTLWGHWHSRPMGKWWYDLPCKQKRHHLFKKWNRRSRFVSYLNFTVCDICMMAAHSIRYNQIYPWKKCNLGNPHCCLKS